jgi:Flp pilus assembly protein TadD
VKGKKRVGKKRGDADKNLDVDVDVDALAGLTAARRLFQRAAFLAPWSAPVWCAWAAAEFRATGDCVTARELYAKGLDADPTNTWCLRGLGEAELAAGRVAQARDYLERALDLEPRNRRCVAALARLEDASGNKARAARYFNVARELLKEQKREEADLIASGRVALRGGSRGVWAPAEAAAAARGVAALNAAEGASYRRADAEGGEAGGGRSAFRAVLAAARGEAAAAKARDRGGREVGARRRAAWRRGDRAAAAEEKTRAAAAPGPGGPGPGGAIGSSLDGIGSSLDDAIGSSLDGIGSSLDDDARGSGRNVASELDLDAEFDAVTRERAWVSFASGDEDAPERKRWGDDAESVDGTVDSMDDDLRRYTGEGRG